MSTILRTGPVRDYWNESCHVWYPRCVATEAYVSPARLVTNDGDGGWAWWVGESVDPLAGGRGEVDWDNAALRGIASTRRAAKAAALAAFREMEEDS